ncbi:MAG: pyridoxamine 5'-phosphate oxidase family protein [Gammaproteobacteria bacterium]|nr:pyridoxamine 5'-phosphate oxidase family protein [Gammaproteobacteria bacterium]
MQEFEGIRLKGPWQAAEVVDFLEQERSPLRLALNGHDGFPLLASLWFRYAEGALWCVTHQDSLVVRRLAQDPRAAFEVSVSEPPYLGVRGQAAVERLPGQGQQELEAMLDRYLGGKDSKLARWLLSRADEEVALRIRPKWLTSWDFRERMSGS